MWRRCEATACACGSTSTFLSGGASIPHCLWLKAIKLIHQSSTIWFGWNLSLAWMTSRGCLVSGGAHTRCNINSLISKMNGLHFLIKVFYYFHFASCSVLLHQYVHFRSFCLILLSPVQFCSWFVVAAWQEASRCHLPKAPIFLPCLRKPLFCSASLCPLQTC